jgi:transposase
MSLPTDLDPPPAVAAGSPGAVIQAQAALIDELRAQNTALQARTAELERQLGSNISDSGKPPSGDGPKKPPARVSGLRERSGKKSGGQRGHPGKTSCQAEATDVTAGHFPSACSGCGAALADAAAVGHIARRVFDLPGPPPLPATGERAHRCQCAACGARTRAAFPEGAAAPAQYGGRTVAFAAYLPRFQLLPGKHPAALAADLPGAGPSAATAGAMGRSCAARFRGLAAALRDRVAAAPVKHRDGTGSRTGGRTQWLHAAADVPPCLAEAGQPAGQCPRHCHARLREAVLHVEERLARAVQHAPPARTEGGGGDRERGPGVQDATPVAAGMPGLEPGARTGRCAAAALHRATGRCYRAMLRCRPGRGTRVPRRPTLVSTARKRQGRKPRRVGHNLLLRLRGRKGGVLRFLSGTAVPFANNLAERDGRMMKVRQKISGGFRSDGGTEDFSVISSLISTARKQARDILRTLAGQPDNLAAQLRLE